MNILQLRLLWIAACGALLFGCGGGGGGGGGDDNDDSLVTTITISPAAPGIEAGATQQFTAAVTDQYGDPMNGVTLSWESSNEDVATISASGLASAIMAGTSDITASAGSVTSNTATLTVSASSSVAGTAATGAPLANAAVVLKDSAGTERSATTDASGAFGIDTSGLIPPFLIEVTPEGGGAALFSVSNSASPEVINVHPLTDLVIRAWYEVLGTTVETAFAAPAANPPPAPGEIAFIVAVVENVIATWLADAGLDPDEFDLIATPFAADGTGFDGVLDDTSVDAATGTIAIDDGVTTQDSVLDVDAAGDSIVVNTTVTNADGTSSSQDETVVPTDDIAAAALAGVEALFADFAATVNGAGEALTADELLPYFSSDALFEGLDRTQTAANFASFLRGITLTGAEILRIDALDAANGVITGEMEIALQAGDFTGAETLPMTFIEEGDAWRFHGDRSLAAFSVHLERRVEMRAAGVTVNHSVNVDVRPQEDTVTTVTVSGGNVWTDEPVPQSGQTDVEDFEPAPGETLTVTRDVFFLNSGALGEVPVAGTTFTLVLALTGGGSAEFVETIGGVTDEAVTITTPTAHTLGAFPFDTPIDVTWTLPTTFPIAEIQLGGQAFTADQASGGAFFSCNLEASELATDATSGQVSLPATCNGEPVLDANINLAFNGANGERIQIIYAMND